MTTAIKKQTEAKGFALYVGITEQQECTCNERLHDH